MSTTTKLAIAAVGLWLYWRVHKTQDAKLREVFPYPGATDRDSIAPDQEHRAMVDRFVDIEGKTI